MAKIRIHQKHQLSHKKAKAAAQKVADQLAEEYDLESEWDGDVLIFRRSGVNGTLVVTDSEAKLDITLGFLLSAFAGKIEAHVAKNMKQVFGAKA
jgi:putative polyhydroxyalkanoate system protein